MRDVDRAFQHSCAILDVVPIGPVVTGYSNRSRGALVWRNSDSRELWLKTSGVFDRDNWFWVGEREVNAHPDLPKLRAVKRVEWENDGSCWAATLMNPAPSPAAEQSPVAGRRAHKVSDGWLRELKDALGQVAGSKTKRQHYTFEEVANVLSEHYGIETSLERKQWRPSHGDLHWSNLTAPRFSILDWECFSMAPPGLDAAWLMAYSANEPRLAARIERAFADELTTMDGLQVRLYATHRILGAAKHGWINPVLIAPLEQELDALLARLRTLRSDRADVGDARIGNRLPRDPACI